MPWGSGSSFFSQCRPMCLCRNVMVSRNRPFFGDLPGEGMGVGEGFAVDGGDMPLLAELLDQGPEGDDGEGQGEPALKGLDAVADVAEGHGFSCGRMARFLFFPLISAHFRSFLSPGRELEGARQMIFHPGLRPAIHRQSPWIPAPDRVEDELSGELPMAFGATFGYENGVGTGTQRGFHPLPNPPPQGRGNRFTPIFMAMASWQRACVTHPIGRGGESAPASTGATA